MHAMLNPCGVVWVTAPCWLGEGEGAWRRAPITRGEHAMQIVDAQIHVWGSGLPSNLAHRQVTAFTTEEAVGLMDEGGVNAAVIHPPGWDPNSTEMACAAVRNYPG